MAVHREERQASAQADRPTADLVREASEEVSHLIRSELRLAQAELTEKGKHAGIGAGLFGGGGLVALYGVGALVAAAILGIAEGLEPWLSALIVGVALLVIAGILALLGRRQVREASPPMPEHAMEGMRADVDAIKGGLRR